MAAVKKLKHSTKIAVGGLTTALCIILMFLTGLFPFATFALPAIAGALLVLIVIEINYSTAVLVYIAVSILSLILAPDKEAALFFVALFGYYPIAKGKIEGLRKTVLSYVLKFAIFNASIAIVYSSAYFIFNLTEVFTNDFGKYTALILIILGNITFLIYDIALTRVISIYVFRLRERFFKNFK